MASINQAIKAREDIHIKQTGSNDYVAIVKLDDDEVVFLPKHLIDAINEAVGNANQYVDLTSITN